MKIITSLLLLCLAAFPTFAQESTVQCGTVADANKVISDYQETLVFKGLKQIVLPDKPPIVVMVMLTVNPQTGSWSKFEVLPNGVVCLTEGGEKGKLSPILLI